MGVIESSLRLRASKSDLTDQETVGDNRESLQMEKRTRYPSRTKKGGSITGERTMDINATLRKQRRAPAGKKNSNF